MKSIPVSYPEEVIELLDLASAGAPRSKTSIKLLRYFFKENPPVINMSGLQNQKVVKTTLRVPADLVEQLDELAQVLAYPRHTMLLVALMASLGQLGHTNRIAVLKPSLKSNSL